RGHGGDLANAVMAVDPPRRAPRRRPRRDRGALQKDPRRGAGLDGRTPPPRARRGDLRPTYIERRAGGLSDDSGLRRTTESGVRRPCRRSDSGGTAAALHNGGQLMARRLKAVRDPKQIERDWETNPRWDGITRDYTADDVLRLRGSIDVEQTFAELGAERLWELLQDEPYVAALGALTGNQAIQQIRAGLKAIYLSGWQVAADANLSGHMYPDQSLYPSNSVPAVV